MAGDGADYRDSRELRAGSVADLVAAAPSLVDQPDRILDTAHIINELKQHVQCGHAMVGMRIAGPLTRVRHFAPIHVYEEIYRDDGHGHSDKFEKLEEQSHAEGWPTESAVFRDLFEREYLPRIQFVKVQNMFEFHPLPQSVGNPSDVPTGRLAALMACSRPIVLSPDVHLRKPGLAPTDIGPLIQATAMIEIADSTIIATGYVSAASAQQLNREVKWVARQVDVSPTVIWVGLIAVVVIAGYFVMRVAERREKVVDAFRPIVGFYVQVGQQAQEATVALDGARVPSPVKPMLEQQIAGALAAFRAPIDSEVVTALVNAAALGPERSVAEIESMLTAHPCFERREEGWQMGGVREPPGR